MKRLICMDLDGTLSQPRTRIDSLNYRVLEKLATRYKLLMVGAGSCMRIYAQLLNFPIDILGNYGMQESRMEAGKFKMIRNDKIEVDLHEFTGKCAFLRQKYGYTAYYGESFEIHPSGMVTFPLLGTAAPIEEKLRFDSKGEKRRAMYREVRDLFPDYNATIGGTNSFDFPKKEFSKYSSICRYAVQHKYAKEEILFLGDDFADGGGDSSVRLGGDIDYLVVEDYRNFPDLMEPYL